MILIPALIRSISWLSMQTHVEPLPGSHLRFEKISSAESD